VAAKEWAKVRGRKQGKMSVPPSQTAKIRVFLRKDPSHHPSRAVAKAYHGVSFPYEGFVIEKLHPTKIIFVFRADQK